MSINPKSALTLQKGLSEAIALEPISLTEESIRETVAKYIGSSAVIVVWQVNQIAWGKLSDGDIIFPEINDWNVAFCQEMRVFNDNKEIHLVKNGNNLSGRLRIDGSGDETVYVDSIAPMWGRAVNTVNGFTSLADEARKLHLNVPESIASSKRCGLVTRNYVVSDKATGLSGYGDYRFLALQELEV